MLENTAVLRIGGVEWKGWKDINVTRQIDALSGSFSLSLTDKWQEGQEPLPLAAGMECTVILNGTQVINGYIDDDMPSFSLTEHTIQVTGRDKTCDLVDCSAVHSPGQWLGLDALSLAVILAAPFGIGVRAEAPVGEAFPVFTLEHGETAFEALDRLLKQRELLALPDDGGFVLASIGKERMNVVLEEGVNILSGRAKYSMKERYSDYIVHGQQPGNNEEWGEAAAQVQGETQDTAVPRYRPFLIRAENQVNPNTAKKRAEWEKTVRAARAVSFEITVPGWSPTALSGSGSESGDLWTINKLVTLHSPSLRVNQEFLIARTVFSQSISGSSTTLELKDPKAYMAEPQKQAEAAKGGTSYPDLQEARTSESELAHKRIEERG